MLNVLINQLLNYGLSKEMIAQEDVDYAANRLLALYELQDFERMEEEDGQFYDVLRALIDQAVKLGLCEDDQTHRDLFEPRIMDCLMPRPSEVVAKMNRLYAEGPKKATDYFYQLSIHSNYIQKERTDRNIKFSHFCKYGDMQISINLSKPEKDPKAIAKASQIKSTNYPKCLLCKENVGFAGNEKHPARQTHRIYPLSLDGQKYYMQYSPYVYYNEHCIVFNEEHRPMVIDHQTFEHLVSFLDVFPHYMIGSNADLPIVGGSILSHDHYQGGRHTFPMDGAKVIKEMQIRGFDNIQVDMLYWPLSTLRLTSASKEDLVECSNRILEVWRNYSDESCGIRSHTQDTPHNTITPIARRRGERYQMDLVLRNNRCSDEHPLGIFHPHQEHHHIKKENIGLIEVMGLAILPARLKSELETLKACLLGKKNFEQESSVQKHKDWYAYLAKQDVDPSNVDKCLEEEITKKYVAVLEDAGVYKMDEQGVEGFTRFVESINKSL